MVIIFHLRGHYFHLLPSFVRPRVYLNRGSTGRGEKGRVGYELLQEYDVTNLCLEQCDHLPKHIKIKLYGKNCLFNEVTLKDTLRHGDRRQMFFGGSETQNVFDLSGKSRTVNVNSLVIRLSVG